MNIVSSFDWLPYFLLKYKKLIKSFFLAGINKLVNIVMLSLTSEFVGEPLIVDRLSGVILPGSGTS